MKLLAPACALLLWLLVATGCQAKGPVKEDFESGRKDAYAPAVLTLASGKWSLNNALLGNSANDKKNGRACVRIKADGFLSMEYDLQGTIEEITCSYATYGSDAPAEWLLQYSTSKGAQWINAGPPVQATPQLTTSSFPINQEGPIRFRIQKLGGGRLNIDDFTTGGGGGPASTTPPAPPAAAPHRDDNTALGIPVTNRNEPALVVITRSQFTLCYNGYKGHPDWVSWHLSPAWKGPAARCNCFTPDNKIPARYLDAKPQYYRGSGFDKGHLCPSEDRDGSDEDNRATFLMSNMAPQAPNLNRDVWEKLESYCRKLMAEGNELYIIAGAYGSGGIGANGRKEALEQGLYVPSNFWKVIVVLPTGDNDRSRVDAATRVIAVDMPNRQDANNYQWSHYRVSVDELEQRTGYDLLNALPENIQAIIEARVDDGDVR